MVLGIFNLIQFTIGRWEVIRAWNEVYYKLEPKGKAEYIFRGLIVCANVLQMTTAIVITIAGLFYMYNY